MKLTTILALNKLNTDFYNQISQEFSDSRNYFWKGWDKIIPHLQKNEISVLDLGCGNGRFAKFLKEKTSIKFSYHGVDNNSPLLDILIEKKINNLDLKTSKIDIIDSLLNENLIDKLGQNKYDLIGLFGVMHHIPSFNLRKKLIELLVNRLKKNGLLVISFWQFYQDERFHYKNIVPENLGIKSEELEEDDYILDWKRGKTAYRYFHFSREKEIEALFSGINGVEIIEKYPADGKSNDLNKYVIIRLPAK